MEKDSSTFSPPPTILEDEGVSNYSDAVNFVD